MIAAFFRREWFAPAPAQRLAALRVLIGTWSLVYVLSRGWHIYRTSQFPAPQFAPVGPIRLLHTPLSQSTLAACLGATVITGVMFALGKRWRLAGPAYALLLLWVTSYRNSWGMVFHTENLVVLHVLVLASAPAADAWSLDRHGLAPVGAHGRYRWPIWLMCAVTASTYFIAGWTKVAVSGWDWVFSDNLRNFIAYDNLRKAELGDHYSVVGATMVRYPWIFPPLAAAALGLELGAPLALINRRVARLWCGCAWAFHAGVVVTMWIVFPYPLLGVAYAPFFRLERAFERLQRLARRHNHATKQR